MSSVVEFEILVVSHEACEIQSENLRDLGLEVETLELNSLNPGV